MSIATFDPLLTSWPSYLTFDFEKKLEVDV